MKNNSPGYGATAMTELEGTQAPPTTTTKPTTETVGRPSWFIVRVTCIAGLGGILFGYDLGVITSALPHLAIDFDLNNPQQEWANSILYVGGFGGAILGGSICDSLGRKTSILICDVLFMVGAAILFVAPTYSMVLMGRIVVGFAVALSGIADVSYLHEIAPTQWRGAIVSVNEACISLGFLFAFAVGSILSNGGDGACNSNNNNNDIPTSSSASWRLMFGLSGVVALIQLFGMWDMPESPKWLRECGRYEESEAAWARIRQGDNNQYQDHDDSAAVSTNGYYYNTTTTTTEQTQLTPPPSPPQPVFSRRRTPDHHHGHQTNNNGEETITTTSTTLPSSSQYTSLSAQIMDRQHSRLELHEGPPVGRMERWCWSPSMHATRHLLIWGRQTGTFLSTTAQQYPRQGTIAAFLAITQQLCGQTSVLSYAPQIFASVGSSSDDNSNNKSASCYVQGWAPVMIGLVKFGITVLVIWKIETVGRRPLLVTGIGGIALGLVLLLVASGVPGSSFEGSEFEPDDDNPANSSSSSNGFGLAFSGVLLVVCGYSMSFGTMTWLLTSELFPTEIRGRALGVSTVLNFGSAIFVTSTFLSTQEALGNTALFGCYMFISVMGVLFAILAVPETKERSVQEIDQQLDRMLWWRNYYGQEGRRQQQQRLVMVDDADGDDDASNHVSMHGTSFRDSEKHDNNHPGVLT